MWCIVRQYQQKIFKQVSVQSREHSGNYLCTQFLTERPDPKTCQGQILQSNRVLMKKHFRNLMTKYYLEKMENCHGVQQRILQVKWQLKQSINSPIPTTSKTCESEVYFKEMLPTPELKTPATAQNDERPRILWRKLLFLIFSSLYQV